MALQTVTYDGVPDGSNLAFPPHEIPDTCARYIQDGLLDEVGLLQRRGIVQAVANLPTFSSVGFGIVQAVNPADKLRIAILTADGNLQVVSEDFTTATAIPFGTFSTSPFPLVDSKPAVGGGTLIGVSDQASSRTAHQYLALWKGADKPTYTTGTVTYSPASAVVTGSGTSWAANVVPGMFLHAVSDLGGGQILIGTVKSVTSDTSLTLEEAPLWTATTGKAYTLAPLRGVYAGRQRSGTITCDTAAATVVGSGTKFRANNLATGSWHLFRASDKARIGTVASVQSDVALTLTTNPTFKVENEPYIAVRADGDWSLTTVAPGKMGFLSTAHMEQQFYANNARTPDETHKLFYAEGDDLEAVDLDPYAGNFINVFSSAQGAANTPLVAIASAYTSMLLLKENEAFTLNGSSDVNFELRKIGDDGALSTMSVQGYDGGVLFAGKNGIFAYNGVQLTNIIEDRLGEFYKSLIRTFNSEASRMYSMIYKDHYFLFMEAVTPSYTPRKGQEITEVTRMTLSIYLPTRAVTFHTNLDLRGAITLPASTGRGTYFLVNGSASSGVASFGNTTAGVDYVDTENLGAGVKQATKFVSAPGGRVERIHAYMDGNGTATTGAQDLVAVVYADSAGEPGARIGFSDEVVISTGEIPRWIEFNFSTQPTLTAGQTYWLGIHQGGDSFVARLYHSNTSGQGVFGADTYPGEDNPWNAGDRTHYGVTHSIYATVVPTPGARLCAASDLFETDGTDAIQCDGNTFGPDFYIESKRYPIEDSLRKKLYKLLLLHYWAAGDNLKLDTVVGLNDNGTTSLSEWERTLPFWDDLGTIAPTWDSLGALYDSWDDLSEPRFQVKRIKFIKRSQHFAFRIYQKSNLVTHAKLGPWSIGFKPQRVGRS